MIDDFFIFYFNFILVETLNLIKIIKLFFYFLKNLKLA